MKAGKTAYRECAFAALSLKDEITVRDDTGKSKKSLSLASLGIRNKM